ncbi:tRNA (guanine(37)-N(1))-methyltransferase [Amia ocellicauda]|uniref:tRNA (guanine(37)-N(1))-methyltransferase n=1 Tax=Amia ocellicauda TaxID=2972642 RepID=UPI00346475CD
MVRCLLRVLTSVITESCGVKASPAARPCSTRPPRFLAATVPLCLSRHVGVRSLQAMPEEQAEPEPGLYVPPPEVRGMTTLDRAAFRRTVTVPALCVRKELINTLMKTLKRVGLQRPGLKRVVEAPDGDHRLVLLDPGTVSSPACFNEVEMAALERFQVSVELQSHELQLSYDNLKSEEILRAVLPLGQDVTSGFSRVGHIAHMNLRDHQLPYKGLIGQVIMDKNPGVTCVVNKTNTIDSTYRNFQMEVLAGDGNMVAKVRENSVTYEFDFSRVYWNPRLSTEHERVVSLLRPGDAVFDVFAGVGPFAVPAARRGCSVFANDLNPESHRWLLHNCKINKAERNVRVFNMDGRDFIRGPLREELPRLLRQSGSAVHVVMNLPALALEFLDAFRGLLRPGEGLDSEDLAMPRVHCYGFSKHEEPQRDVTARAEASLGAALEGCCSVHLVRNVAPNKEMMCISFALPREVLFQAPSPQPGTPASDSPERALAPPKDAEEPAPKRPRCEEQSS